MEEGDPGDKFYVVLKGTCEAMKAFETPIPQCCSKGEDTLDRYLQFLMQNFSSVFWRRVPYAHEVFMYLEAVISDKDTLVLQITSEIELRMTQFFQRRFVIKSIKKNSMGRRSTMASAEFVSKLKKMKRQSTSSWSKRKLYSEDQYIMQHKEFRKMATSKSYKEVRT